ncbi:DNA-processing protein DprA [Streptomyces exfoliatus]|uniref:DNA-processing protein DprA n=1 Tax=Streptomyces exfoliatus TaxID=1905 RepID=UPI003F4CDE26
MTGTTAMDERRARATLSRAVEPGDEHAGRWLRRHGATGFLDRLLRTVDSADISGDEPFPGTGRKRVASWRLRATAADPDRDLDTIRELGGRFLVPGDTEWPRQLDDLGDARPLGLWVRGPADLRTWALRSVALVGARACTPYGAHTAADLATGLARQGWVVVSGAAYVLCPVTVVAVGRCHSCGGVERNVLAAASIHAGPYGGCRGRVAW